MSYPEGARATAVKTLPLRSPEDVVRVRQAVREQAAALRLSLVEQTKLVTAASELARNTLIYGRGGDAELALVERAEAKGLCVRFIDQGPGIPDVELALTDGYTTGGGLGLGLSGAKRLCDDFSIDTKVGEGSTIAITKWKR